VDFTLTQDQELIRSSARALLEKECPASLVRAHAGDPSVADGLWRHLREWTGLAAGPLVEPLLFLEECGAVLAPGPFFATTALFAPLVRALDDDLFQRVIAGESTGRWRWRESSASGLPTTDPVKRFVPEAERVQHVAAVLPGPRVVFLERPTGRYVENRRHLAAPGRRGGRIRPRCGARELFARGARALPRERRRRALRPRCSHRALALRDHARLRQGPRAVRPADRVLPGDAAQARQHEARARARLERRLLRGDGDRRRRRRPSRAAHAAKGAAGEAAKLCAKDGIQIHGGIGYTWEHDLHLYIRRAYASEHLLGSSDWHRDRLAELIF